MESRCMGWIWIKLKINFIQPQIGKTQTRTKKIIYYNLLGSVNRLLLFKRLLLTFLLSTNWVSMAISLDGWRLWAKCSEWPTTCILQLTFFLSSPRMVMVFLFQHRPRASCHRKQYCHGTEEGAKTDPIWAKLTVARPSGRTRRLSVAAIN